MATLLERLSLTGTQDAEALHTINMYRDAAGERFVLSELENEFPYLIRQLGVDGLYLADAAANYAGTFKWRGAFVKMHEQQQAGVESVTVPSAGNHLRGAIIAGRILGMTVHGVVPYSAPEKKKEGALQLQPDRSLLQLHVEGDTFDESLAWARAHEEEFGPLVHPFDDSTVAAGQGTITDDIFDQATAKGVDVRHIVVPVGGGGLYRGIAQRATVRMPWATIHGVEAEGSNSLSISSRNGRVTRAEKPNKRYGGSAVLTTGEGTLRAYQTLANMQLWSSEDEDVKKIAEDYLDSVEDRGLDHSSGFEPFEPTTLVALAALERIAKEHPGEGIVVVGTGRNDSPEMALQ